jgi:hypothetical protein
MDVCGQTAETYREQRWSMVNADHRRFGATVCRTSADYHGSGQY